MDPTQSFPEQPILSHCVDSFPFGLSGEDIWVQKMFFQGKCKFQSFRQLPGWESSEREMWRRLQESINQVVPLADNSLQRHVQKAPEIPDTLFLCSLLYSIDLVISQGRKGSCGLILLPDKNTHPEGPSATVPREKRNTHVLLMLQKLAQASLSCTLGSLEAEECYFIENCLTAYQGS